jgi:hypothetical protein
VTSCCYKLLSGNESSSVKAILAPHCLSNSRVVTVGLLQRTMLMISRVLRVRSCYESFVGHLKETGDRLALLCSSAAFDPDELLLGI